MAKSVGWLGDYMATIALMLRLQSTGHGAGSVALLLIADAVPVVLLAGPAGRLVDRVDNTRLVVIACLGQAAVCTALAEARGTAAVLALVAVLGAGQSVVGAAWQALLAEAAPGDALPRALGQVQAGMTLASVAAPALAGVLTGAYSARVPLLADAATFAVAAGLAALLTVRRQGSPATDSEAARGGWAIVRGDALLRPLFVLLGLVVLLGCAVNVVDVFLVRGTLGASTTWYGIVGACFSAGAVFGALGSGRLRGVSAQARAFVAAALALSVGIAAIGLSPSVAVLLPIAVVVGTTNGVLNVTLSSLVMGSARPDQRGRVAAALSGTTSGTQIAAFGLCGALATVLSARQIFVGAGVLGAVAPALLAPHLLRAARAHTATSTHDLDPAVL